MKILPLIFAWMMTGCGLVNSVADTAGNILGVEDNPPPQDAVIRNEYHAACVRAKQERIMKIMGEEAP